MSRAAWALIKNSNNFNVNIFRRGLSVLLVSLIFSGVLGFFIFRSYIHTPERDYYATNGVTAPVQLKGLSGPNNSPEPLLEPDPPTDDAPRVIPQ